MIGNPVQSRAPLYGSQSLNRKHPLARGLQGFWVATPRQVGSPKWNDLVAGVQGTVRSGVVWKQTTMPEMAGDLFFPGGASQWVDVGTPSSLTLSGEATCISFAMSTNWSSPNSAPYIFADNASQFGSGANSGKFRTVWNGSAFGTGATTLTNGIWYMLASVRFGSTGAWNAETWIGPFNGTLKKDGSGSTATNPGSLSNQYSIGNDGADSTSATKMFGHIAAVAVYNRRVVDLELEQWFNIGRQGFPGILNSMRRSFALKPAAAAAGKGTIIGAGGLQIIGA